eukprot:PITA_26063
MVDEMESLHKNEALDLVESPNGRKPIGNKWVFKKKTNAEAKVEKYEACLVGKGYSQVSGIDFGDIFSHIAEVTSIRLLLFVVVYFDFEVEHMDVKITFLHRDLEEDIYMKQPEGFVVKGKKELDLKTHLSSKFDMKDLGDAYYILGMEIKRDRIKRKLWLNQMRYVGTILQRFNMQDSKPVKVPIHVGVKLYVEQCPKTQEEEEDISGFPYAREVGSLMYVMAYTRPDIAHAVVVLSRFMSKLGKEHWTIVKRVLKYLHGTSYYVLCYQGRLGLGIMLDIHGFVDVHWVGDMDWRRSTSGYVFNLFRGAVSWMSKKQSIVELSSTEVEYMVATPASKEAVWLQRLCSNMGLVQGAIRIDCDSQSAIFLANNPAYHSKTKHIDVPYHFVRDMIEEKKVLLVKVDTFKNIANALTKSVSSEKFSWCRETMGIAMLDN